jgi:hypothetical protein
VSLSAVFRGGGPRDGDEVDLPTTPDLYETVSAGQIWVYERRPGTDDPVVYTLRSHRPASG